MTTHAAILEQLEKYEGGRFVPRDLGGATLQYTNQYRFGSVGAGFIVCPEDARAHIERAAFRAVDHFCRKSGCSMLIGRNRVGGMIVSSAECDLENDGSYTFDPIGCGPDEPAMWLAAMKYINGERG